ncbi:MAG TPA: OsmC family peroxiredoxin [Leucothrix sp.]|nr:OsmC family peroxiredoxin [Leucothrix sp.]
MHTEIIVENTTHRYTQKITAGNHELLADEPKDLKGDDLGPAPFDLLLSALGSCTSITLSMYAEMKKIKLDLITVRLNYIPPNKLEDTPSRITRKIHLEGDFTEEQHHRMLEIADRCPVHRTLRRGVDIMSSME